MTDSGWRDQTPAFPATQLPMLLQRAGNGAFRKHLPSMHARKHLHEWVHVQQVNRVRIPFRQGPYFDVGWLQSKGCLCPENTSGCWIFWSLRAELLKLVTLQQRGVLKTLPDPMSVLVQDPWSDILCGSRNLRCIDNSVLETSFLVRVECRLCRKNYLSAPYEAGHEAQGFVVGNSFILKGRARLPQPVISLKITGILRVMSMDNNVDDY